MKVRTTLPYDSQQNGPIFRFPFKLQDTSDKYYQFNSVGGVKLIEINSALLNRTTFIYSVSGTLSSVLSSSFSRLTSFGDTLIVLSTNTRVLRLANSLEVGNRVLYRGKFPKSTMDSLYTCPNLNISEVGVRHSTLHSLFNVHWAELLTIASLPTATKIQLKLFYCGAF
ncbi:hypothetical protein ABKN59_004944 [Abortiporus biennis]